MAKNPDKPTNSKNLPKKDPARPTRAKAARPDDTPTPDALANLLNPGIGRGTAGMGSGTGLQPPPDNSWDRRRDFSEAHKARKSTPKEFNEAPQRDYTASPITGLDPQLEKELGLGDGAAPPHRKKAIRNIVFPVPTCRRSPAVLPASPANNRSSSCCATAGRNFPPCRGRHTGRRARRNPKAENAL